MAEAIYNRRAWALARAAVMARDQGKCTVGLPGCTKKATAVDHVVPWRKGGAWYDLSNLRAICTPCNSALANKGRARVVDSPASRHW